VLFLSFCRFMVLLIFGFTHLMMMWNTSFTDSGPLCVCGKVFWREVVSRCESGHESDSLNFSPHTLPSPDFNTTGLLHFPPRGFCLNMHSANINQPRPIPLDNCWKGAAYSVRKDLEKGSKCTKQLLRVLSCEHLCEMYLPTYFWQNRYR